MNVHILGMAPDCREDDPPFEVRGWEVWVNATDVENVFRGHCVFEMHTPDCWRRFGAPVPVGFEEMLAELDRPLYMHDHYPEFPASIAYPADEIERMVGVTLGCTIAYQIGLAIAMRAKHIEISGVRAREEHLYQRANLNHLIGFAKGRGIKVTDNGGLQEFPLDVSPGGKSAGYNQRYGLAA